MDTAMSELVEPEESRVQPVRAKRDTLASNTKLWPGGVIPYIIEDSIGNNNDIISKSTPLYIYQGTNLSTA